MSGRRPVAGPLSLAFLVLLTACSSVPTTPRDLLDERTGITVTVAGAPITFAGNRTAQTSHNFLTLVAIQKDDDGKITALLLLYRDSVFYGAAQSSPEANADEVLIVADGHPIRLRALPQLPSGLPAPKDLYVPDVTDQALHAYVTDLESLNLIAISHALTLTLPADPASGIFELWDDGRAALRQFVEHLSAP